MITSKYGKELQIEVTGASHAPQIDIVIHGLPAGRKVDLDKAQDLLNRRKGGQNAYSTKRAEADTPEVLSGLEKKDDGYFTNGEDLKAVFYNQNTRSSDYEQMKYVPRPSHADYTSYMKYGDSLDRSGGGMFSGRMTLPICFAGAICMQLLEEEGISIFAHVSAIGKIRDDKFDPVNPDKNAVPRKAGLFPVINKTAGDKMVEFMTACAGDGDSIGGVIECAVTGLPAGVGEPLYDSMESTISHMMFGIPAVKAIEFGSGFYCGTMKGSECNDPFIIKDGKVATATNHSGGIQGGISNGMPVIFRVCMKPTPSIYKEQRTVNMKELTETTLTLVGRHDPCIVPRAVPCIEAACAIAVYNLYMQYKSAQNADDLTAIRSKIDGLDEEIAGLIAKRMDLAEQIAGEKAKQGLPVRNPKREEEVLNHVSDVAGDAKGEYVKEIYRTLIDKTCEYEEKKQ
jgi:chorismate synthase